MTARQGDCSVRLRRSTGERWICLRLGISDIGKSKPCLPERCPFCGNVAWHSHGWVRKSVRDPQVGNVHVQRIRCTQCGKTLRLYPSGLGRGAQSDQLRLLSVLLWSLGATYRDIENVLSALGYQLRYSSVCRNVRQFLATSPSWPCQRLPTRRIKILDVNQGPSWAANTGGILFLVSNGVREALVGIDLLEDEDPEALHKAILKRLKEFMALGTTEVRTPRPVFISG